MKSEDFCFAGGQPNVLFLKDICLADHISPEELADQKFSREENYFINKIVYDTIPFRFTSFEDWPTETNLL